METTGSTIMSETPAAGTAGPPMSPFARAIAVFTRPADAWGGLKERAQWWFPLVILIVFAAVSAALLHHRALVPMMIETWEEQVANGQMQPEQVERMVQFFSGPTGIAFSLIQQVILMPVILLLTALIIWFGVGFVLGTGMRYRLALEVAAWSALITLPAYILTAILAWTKQTMRGIHVGFGILLPEMEPASKFHVALGAILDALGPLSIWYVIVAILGAAALSGAKTKSVAWVLGGLYVAVTVLLAALAAMFAPAS
jgi:hypothetical protein